MPTLNNKIIGGADQQLQEIREQGDQEIAEVTLTGNTEQSEVEQAGAEQVALIKTEGDTQVPRVAAAGTTQVARVESTGDTQTVRITDEGDTQFARISSEGGTQTVRITDEGNTQFTRLSSKGNEESSRLETEADSKISTMESLKVDAETAGQTATTQAGIATTQAGQSAASAAAAKASEEQSKAYYEGMTEFGVSSVNGRTGNVTLAKGDVGLDQVDNTGDADKPVSIAQANINAVKADLVGGRVPASQLPAYVDDVLSFPTFADFPSSGEDGVVYIAKDTNVTYRWGGTSYVTIGSDLALGETSLTAYRGDRGKIAYDHSQETHDKAYVGLDQVDNTSDADKPVSIAQANINTAQIDINAAQANINAVKADLVGGRVPASQLPTRLPLKSDRDESIRQNNLIFEASGVLESDTYKARPQEDSENLLICDDGMKVNVAGLVYDVSGLAIRQSSAPDGTQTFDSTTGEFVQHADVDTAFASVTATNEVVTHPVTMYGTEAGWSEAITPEHPFVYKDGCIQAQATEVSGIATTKGNQPASYYACFEGDVNSIGDGVNWFTLTDEQKAKVSSENHVWIDADGTVVQDRLRMRSVNGLGNGDWANVDSLSGSLGYNNFVHDPDNKGVFSNTTSKFLVLGTQSRLNTGRFHQSYNPFGSLTDTDGLDWYNSTHKINSQLDAFKNVGVAPAYHYNRYANRCYSDGIGGIIDMSLDAYGVDIESVKAKNSVLRDGSFRGKERVVFSKSDGAVITEEELNLSVQGNIQNLDVVGDPADILANTDLVNGWLGSYAGIGSGAKVDLSRKAVNTIAIGTVSTSDNGNSYAAEEGTVENTLNQSGNIVDATEVSLISYQGHSSMTEPCPNSEIVGGDVGEVFVTDAHNRASFVESTINKVSTGASDNYQELSLTETKIDGKLIGSQNHTPISIVGSTSPAVKVLDYVINDNEQAKIGLQANELIYTDSWNDNSKVEPVDDTTTGTDVGGNTRILTSCKTAMPIGWLKKGYTKDSLDPSLTKKKGWVGVLWDQEEDTYTRTGDAPDVTNWDNEFPWNTMRKCNLDDEGYVTAYYGDPNYKTDGSNGQVMTEMGLTYLYYRFENGVHDIRFSQQKLDGYEVDPTFLVNGEECDHVYFSTFEGCGQKADGTILLNDEAGIDFNADKLMSIAGSKPISGANNALNINNARKLANNRGLYWGMPDSPAQAFIQHLLAIEFASWNSQEKVGLGVVNKASGTGNEAEITGQTKDIMKGYTGTNGLSSVAYLGVENLWGNVFNFLDGINIRDHEVFANVTNENFVSDKFDGNYVSQGFASDADGYVSTILGSNYGVFATAVGGSNNTFISDYYYTSSGNRIAPIGGSWSSGSHAGLCSLLAYYGSSNVGRSIGARLLFRKPRSAYNN